VTTTKYLVVGGGMTGDAAVKGIREQDSEGTITLVGTESHPPYKRPPLSKGLWSGGEEEKIWRGTEEAGADLRLGRTILSIDPQAHVATDDQGEEYRYGQVLLATGGRPRRLPGAESAVIYFRTLDDYRRLRELAGERAHVVVIGGGFIGSELAASLTSAGAKVTMVFPDQAICARLFPPDLADFVTQYYRDRGVDVLSGEAVAAVEPGLVRTGSGKELQAEAIVAGLGIEPATELAASMGLDVDNGIVVDEYGKAGADVWAAGDVARFPHATLGPTRIEHEDHANTQGKVVGGNMAGAGQPYDHIPFFYSDLFDLGYEAVGGLDSRQRALEHWVEPYLKGVIAYVDDERRPRGFLLWDVWGKVDAASELLRAGEPIDKATLAGLV
jgi:3-phenylpropionate/trans-cinnamate dioxygenase ferredoxin reductase component